jgi:alpha-tubulin suppressor-like RCC1 family protein
MKNWKNFYAFPFTDLKIYLSISILFFSYSCNKKEYTTDYYSSPVEVRGLDEFISVSAGQYHTCAIKKDGSLWCWGTNYEGAINGNLPLNQKFLPTKVMNDVIYVSASFGRTCTIKKDSSLWCWGLNGGILGDGGMGTHSCDEYNKENKNCNLNPTKIADEVKSLSLAQSHGCILKNDNSLWCWGNNKFGELCDGTNIPKTSPSFITGEVVSFTCGGYYGAIGDIISFPYGGGHSCYLKKDGTLKCCGWNMYNQTATSFVNYEGRESFAFDVLNVYAGDGYQTCFLKKDNSLWCFGREFGSDEIIYPPRKVLDDVIFADIGNAFGCAIKQDGSLWCWNSIHYPSPFKIDDDVISLSLGAYHFCYVKKNGKVFCQGSNLHGQLGIR